jgi:ketosteroid isomerase-like protein
MTPLETALAFIAAINAADTTALRALMTDDHTFTDALAHSFSGAEAMLSGWKHFFHAYPGYRIAEVQSNKIRRWTVFSDTGWATPPKT